MLDAGWTGSRRLPAFDDWEGLIVDGVKMFVVNFVYAGIPALVFLGGMTAVFVGLGLGVASESGGVVLVALLFGGAVALVSGLVWLAGMLLVPAALARMRDHDELGAAFHVRTLFGVVTDRDYLVAVGLAWTVGFAISTVGSLLSLLLVGLPVLFVGGLVTFHLFGQGYARAVGPSGRRSREVPSSTDPRVN